MGQTREHKLIKAFKAKYPQVFDEDEDGEVNCSANIELDNLDMAKLTYTEDGEVVVENEHGTQFPVSDLSKIEIKCFELELCFIEK